ncbi:hypothetical protein U1Q18_007968, partial [Sarracenia purpurea var. burkii]
LGACFSGGSALPVRGFLVLSCFGLLLFLVLSCVGLSSQLILVCSWHKMQGYGFDAGLRQVLVSLAL